MAPLSAAQLLELSETNVSHRLTPEEFLPALTQAPFINVEGTFNVRDLGKIPSVDANGGGGGVRPGFAFRSGMLVSLTPNGKATLAKDLGVRRVFDLRSKSEHATLPDPAVSEDVTIVWQEAAEETPHVSLEPFIEGVGEAGFADMYLDVLRAYRPTIKLVLEHVRDRPQEPFLFHCTAGRDRTGVLAGLLETLAGAPTDVVELDYMLTRIGMEPVRDEMVKFARTGSSDESDESKPAGPAPGFLNLISLRVVCWHAFLVALENEYGGFEGYIAKALGFSAEDVATIKKNLTTAPQ